MDESAVTLARTIGVRVKQERKSRGWTLDQFAESAGVSRRMVINVEKGTVNPSVGTLLRLADALGVGLPTLVEPLESRAAKVTRSGEGALLWTGTAGGRGVLVAGTEPPEVVELWDWTLSPGERHASEAHAAGTRELLQVQQGAVTVDVAGESHLLGVGDALAFHGDAEHSYSNLSDTLARFTLIVYEPGVGQVRRVEVRRV